MTEQTVKRICTECHKGFDAPVKLYSPTPTICTSCHHEMTVKPYREYLVKYGQMVKRATSHKLMAWMPEYLGRNPRATIVTRRPDGYIQTFNRFSFERKTVRIDPEIAETEIEYLIMK